MKMTILIKEAMCQKIMGEEEKEKEGFWEELNFHIKGKYIL